MFAHARQVSRALMSSLPYESVPLRVSSVLIPRHMQTFLVRNPQLCGCSQTLDASTGNNLVFLMPVEPGGTSGCPSLPSACAGLASACCPNLGAWHCSTVQVHAELALQACDDCLCIRHPYGRFTPASLNPQSLNMMSYDAISVRSYLR